MYSSKTVYSAQLFITIFFIVIDNYTIAIKSLQSEKEMLKGIFMDDFNYKIIGENIRKLRLEKQYTQEYLAEKIGVNTSHISNIENHRTNISLPTLVKVCNALNTTVDYMIRHEYSNPSSSMDTIIIEEIKPCDLTTKERILQIIKILKQ